MSGFRCTFTEPVELIMSERAAASACSGILEDPQDVGLPEGVVETFERASYGFEGFDDRITALCPAFAHEALNSLAHVVRFEQIFGHGLPVA
jgi:hypothetical protein